MIMVISCQQTGDPLEKHLWEDRLLLLITPDTSSDSYQKQINGLEPAMDGLVDRNIIVYTITPEYFQSIDFSSTEAREYVRSSQLYQQYATGNAFEVVVIGYDGGEKLRQAEVLEMTDLFELIDQMPMRKQEMRRE